MVLELDLVALDDPEFQEDSVREEIIAPILKLLGYSVTGENKIVRSRKLIHPFVNIGSKKHKVNIIPDYVLEIDGNPLAIIDAKSPQTSLQKSEHAEQAYSYAIHPEVRAKIYALCNGKEWIIWDVDKFDPVATIKTSEIVTDISKISKYLHPKSVKDPGLRDFLPDYGLRMIKAGLVDGVQHHFYFNQINNIMKVEDDLYTIAVEVEFDDEKLALSFDLDNERYLDFLNACPNKTRSLIKYALSRQPYNAHGFDPVIVSIIGNFGKPTRGIYEDFVPIVVSKLELLNIES